MWRLDLTARPLARLKRGTNVPPYLPSRETIEAQCKLIRESWTEEEERERRGASGPYSFPIVSAVTLGLAHLRDVNSTNE
jgi:hypothetical protein